MAKGQSLIKGNKNEMGMINARLGFALKSLYKGWDTDGARTFWAKSTPPSKFPRVDLACVRACVRASVRARRNDFPVGTQR